jgi:hypothetical protein
MHFLPSVALLHIERVHCTLMYRLFGPETVDLSYKNRLNNTGRAIASVVPKETRGIRKTVAAVSVGDGEEAAAVSFAALCVRLSVLFGLLLRA